MKNFWILIVFCLLILLLFRGIEQLTYLIKGVEINVSCYDGDLILKGFGYTTKAVEVMSSPWYFDYQDPILLDSRWNFDLKKIRREVKNNKVVGTLPALSEIETLETQSSGYKWSSAIKIKSLENNVEGYISNNSSMVCTVFYNGRHIDEAIEVKKIMDKRRSAAKDENEN